MATNGKFKKDALGVRMKEYYEDRTRFMLPRRAYTIMRIDGKAFHTYTIGLKEPFDDGLIEDMDATACYLCKNIQGAKFAYVQSDEISILITDFDKIGTNAWFDNNIQKMVSIASSLATVVFNRLRMLRYVEEQRIAGFPITSNGLMKLKMASFDARVFTIPLEEEVVNYFVWRQQDTVRNSIQSVAHSMYSTNKLKYKNGSEMQEMIFQKGINWNDFAPRYKRGRFISKHVVDLNTPHTGIQNVERSYKRSIWTSGDCPTFSKDRDFILAYTRPNED
jgi:tRNA(His) 5'-end guanylyltransferase